MSKSVTKAVIAAAGFGTRFLPQTKAMPKEMLPLIDKPIIQYIVEDMVAAGIKDIIIVGSSNKRAIEDHFDVPSEDHPVFGIPQLARPWVSCPRTTELDDYHKDRTTEPARGPSVVDALSPGTARLQR